MSLILAIEPDRRQALQLTTLARGPLNLELVVGDTTERAFEGLGPRVPDLVLTSLLLSPKDEAALAERLRELDAAGAHVQTLVIPVLGSEENGRKRPGGGLFGRLRRSSSPEKPSDGCDPAVFGAQIAEYLERAAAERAALAAAQADLEAAWAEEPPPIRAASPNGPELAEAPRSVESVESLESLFGEFASVPMGVARPADEAAVPPLDAATDFSNQLEDEAAQAPPAATSAPPRNTGAAAGQGDEDWEEIALDVSAAPDSHDGPLEAHNDLTAETVDLDAFVHELHTVETTANAQPMIPVVDLTGGSLDDDVDRVRHNDDTVSAIFQAAEPALDLGDELDRAPLAAEPEAPVAQLWEQSLETAPASVDAASGWSETVSVDAAGEAAVAPTAEQAAAALEAEIASVVRPTAVEAPKPPRAGWQDLLSAIRRDLSHMKTEEPASEPQARPELDLSKEPLVFTVRPTLTASAIAEAMPVRAERPATDSPGDGPLPSHAAHQLEASLQASLQAPLALTPEPTTATPGAEVSERQAAVEAQLARAIKTSATEISQPVIAEPLQTATVEEAVEASDVSAFAAEVAVAAEFAAEPPVDSLPLEAVAEERQPETCAPPVDGADDVSTDTRSDDSVMSDAVAAAFTAAATHTGEADALEGWFAEPSAIEPDAALAADDPVIADFEDALAAGGTANGEMPLESAPPEAADLVAEDTVLAADHDMTPMAAAPEAPVAPAAPRRDRKERGSKHRRKRRQEQEPLAVAAAAPRIADWGFFDPQQVGFGALVSKLNEVARRGPGAPLPR